MGDLLRTNYLPLAHMRDEETREKLFVVKDRVNYGTEERSPEGHDKVAPEEERHRCREGSRSVDEGRKRLRALQLQEIDIRLDELELVESTIEKLDCQIRDIVSKDAESEAPGHDPGRGTLHRALPRVRAR